MERELSRPEDYRPYSQATRKKATKASRGKKRPLVINIRGVSANGFTLVMRQPEVEVFSISMDGLDRMIEDRYQELAASPDPQEEECAMDERLLAKTFVELADNLVADFDLIDFWNTPAPE